MARKLTPEELKQAQGDFDVPVLKTLQSKKTPKSKEYVPPKPKKLASEIEKDLFDDAPAPAPAKKEPKKRGHKSPWKEGTELQRVNVFLPVETARIAKAAAVMRGVDLGVVLDELIRENIKIGYMLR